MQQLHLVRILLLPSLLSGSLCVLLACSALFYTNWIYVSHGGALYAFLFGDNGLSAPVQQASGSLLATVSKAFNPTAVYDVLVAVAALVVGGVTYLLLEGFHRAEVNTVRTVHELEARYATHAQDVRRETLMRLVARTVVVTVGGLYMVVLLKMVLPFCIVLFRIGVRSAGSSHGWGEIVGSVLLLAFGLHLVTIFVRLLALRPRLFGGALV